jgi:hypothetical protein
MNKLYTIFVNFNSKNQLYDGIKAVLTLPSVNGVIVVDNGSNDDSLNLIKKINNTNIIIIENSKNVGFYRAVNMGIQKALEMKADLIMPLDFDLDFSSDFISKLLKVDADIVAPILKFKREDKWVYDYGGKINWLMGRSTHTEKSIPLPTNTILHYAGDRSSKNPYDFVSGGCTIFKKGVFEKIGYFDEKYFVYYGDADYSLRASKAGFKVIMDKDTIVHHKLEITKETKNLNKLKIALSDNLVFINKWIKWYRKPFAYFYLILIYIKTVLNLIYRI